MCGVACVCALSPNKFIVLLHACISPIHDIHSEYYAYDLTETERKLINEMHLRQYIVVLYARYKSHSRPLSPHFCFVFRKSHCGAKPEISISAGMQENDLCMRTLIRCCICAHIHKDMLSIHLTFRRYSHFFVCAAQLHAPSTCAIFACMTRIQSIYAVPVYIMSAYFTGIYSAEMPILKVKSTLP